MLVREGALTAPHRTASVAAPVLLTVAFAILISGMVATSADAHAARRAARIDAGAVLVPDGTPGLSDAAAAGSGFLESTVYTEKDEPIEVSGVDRSGTAVTRGLADQHGWTAGQAICVTFADGQTVPVRLAEVIPDEAAPASMLLPRAIVRAHDPSALTSAVYLPRLAPAPSGLGARVVDVTTYAAEADTKEDRLVWIFTLLLIGVSAGYGALAVANTLLLSTTHRMPDFAVLRLAGATRRQVAWTAAAESAMVVAIGTLLGGAVAVAALISIRQGLREQVHAPVHLVVPWPVVGAVVGLCLLLAVLTSALPSRTTPH
jgi:putative ABC transport system permease protein